MKNSFLVIIVLAAAAVCSSTTCSDSNVVNILAGHATESSCWTVITGPSGSVVYDVTRLLRRHEGGRAVVRQLCGVDGTISFNCNHGQGEIRESIRDGDMSVVCTMPTRRRYVDPSGNAADSDDDDDGESARLRDNHPADTGSDNDDKDETTLQDDDDNGRRSGGSEINSRCRANAQILTPPSTPILATEIEKHNSASDCWTALENVALDITKYLDLHPGGKAKLLTMCGHDGTAAFKAEHGYMYITQGKNSGWITVLGTLSGDWTPPDLPSADSPTLAALDMTALALHSSTSDCWILVTDFIYDVTPFRAIHPAGTDVFMCGADNTAVFTIQHPTSYLGRMNKYLVGRIQLSTVADPTAPPDTPTTAGPDSAPTQVLLSEVKAHSSLTDCWVILHCEVLDVTAFIPKHSGDTQLGSANAIGAKCGGDVSEQFDLFNHPVDPQSNALVLTWRGTALLPGSYKTMALALGAKAKGTLAGCTDIPTYKPEPSTTVVGSAEFKVSWKGVTDADPLLTPANYESTKATVAQAVTAQLTSAGYSGVVVTVLQLSKGSLVADLALGFQNYEALESAKSFALDPAGLEAVPFQGGVPVVLEGPKLTVSYEPVTPSGSSGSPSTGSGTSTSEATKITILQVGDHQVQSNCWIAVHGQVWNCPDGGNSHPGGSFFARGLCGKEVTRSFEASHPRSYLEDVYMRQVGCSFEGLLSAELGNKLTAQVTTTILPSLAVQLSNGQGQVALSDYSSTESCWMAIRGNVYSAGSLLDEHDGGRRQVEALCGIDATAAFDCAGHDEDEMEEGIEDYGMAKVGTVDSQLGLGCSWSEPAGLGSVEGSAVAAHAASSDCWVAVHGVVWDLTQFVLKHTGGSRAIASVCGTDGTAAFDRQHPVGFLSILAAKGLPMVGTLASPVPELTLSAASYPAVLSAELARHASVNDCWTALHGFVLDITPFMNQHPGGSGFLTPACGKDGSVQLNAGGHPQGYIALMVEKQFATLQGCLDAACGGAPVAVDSTAPPSDPGTKVVEIAAPVCTASEPSPPDVTVTAAELQAHNTAGNCWLVLGCGVYDVSAYTHSGGKKLVTQWCGKDATSSFSARHPMSYLRVLLTRGGKLVGKAGARQVNYELSRARPVSATELARHESPTDCWSCMAGNVYDLTAFHESHSGGSSLVLPVCGHEGTLILLMAHGLDVLDGLPLVGSCNTRAEAAYTEQNILDGVAFGLYVVLPLILVALVRVCAGIRLQDRLLRRPVAAPRTEAGFWANFVNPYLEMPAGLVLLLCLYLLITAVLWFFWAKHYDDYYPEEYAVPGAAGRMTVYHMSLAAYIGTRRFTWSWWLLHLPYERALKTHSVVGIVALILAFTHAFTYLGAYNWEIPGTVSSTAIPMLVGLCILGPATFPNFRRKFYGVFRVTHYLAPLVVILSCLHVAALAAGGKLPRGFYIALAWVSSAAIFWVLDFIQTCWDAFAKPVTIVGEPRLLPNVSGDASYLSLVCKKATTLYPGCWMSVASPAAGAALSHPFTAIVLNPGTKPGEDAVMEFVWKVNPNQWTDRMYRAVEAGNKTPQLYVTGPFGGGLGMFDLTKIRAMVFVCAGVGVTPVASMMSALQEKKGSFKGLSSVHVVWSFRSMALLEHSRQHFAHLPPSNTHFHFTSKDQPASMGAGVKNGRPNLPVLLNEVRREAADKSVFDIGVFVCGPSAMVGDVLRTTQELNSQQAGTSYFHVHSESFQM